MSDPKMNLDEILDLPIDEMDKQVLEQMISSLSHHAPGDHALDKIRDLRKAAIDFSVSIVKNTPAGRERSLALTNLEQTLMWSVKSVVLNS